MVMTDDARELEWVEERQKLKVAPSVAIAPSVATVVQQVTLPRAAAPSVAVVELRQTSPSDATFWKTKRHKE